MTRLAIIAGQGNLPLQVALAADEKGYDVVIFLLKVSQMSCLMVLQFSHQTWRDRTDTGLFDP